jgi:hypothetical protein
MMLLILDIRHLGLVGLEEEEEGQLLIRLWGEFVGIFSDPAF